MPIYNPGAEKQTRHLRKTPALRFEHRSEAEDALKTVRAHTLRGHGGEGPGSQTAVVMVIINPVSGQGKASQIYKKQIEPILNAAGLQCIEFTTQYRGHATEIVLNAKPGEYSMILSVGGDGTLYEVIQGILNRPDWDEMRNVPLLQVPCGSGNALAACTGLWDVSTAAYAAVKGGIVPLDICSVIQFGPDGRSLPRFYSFLSFAYGMLSCLDIGTEHLRWMGSTRFVVGALQQIWQQKTFPVRVAYLEATSMQDYGVTVLEREEGEGEEEEAPKGFGPQLHHFRELAKTCQVKAGPGIDRGEGLAATHSTLPPGWLWMPAEEIQLFAACNLPRLDMNFHFAPDAHASSGHLNLLYTAGKAGRRRGFELLTSSEKGNHMHLVEQHKPVALYIEPLAANSTWLVVDGELVPHAPLFAEVHPGLCRVVCAECPQLT